MSDRGRSGIATGAATLGTGGPHEPQSTGERANVPYLHSFTSCAEGRGGKYPGSEALQIGELWYCHVLTTEEMDRSENKG